MPTHLGNVSGYSVATGGDYSTPALNTVGATCIIVSVQARYASNSAPDSVTDTAGNTYDLVGFSQGTSGYGLWIYKKINPITDASNIVTASWGVDRYNATISQIAYQDVLEVYGFASDSIFLENTVNVLNANDLILSFANAYVATFPFTYGTGQVELFNFDAASTGPDLGVTEETPGIGNDTQEWTNDSGTGQNIASIILEHGTDTTAPVLQSVSVENDAPDTIVEVYDEALDTGSTPANGDYNIDLPAGKSVIGVTVTGNEVRVQVDSDFEVGDTIQYDYTAGTNPVRDIAENNAANLVNQLVTNNLTPIPDVKIHRYDANLSGTSGNYTLSTPVADITKAFIRMIGATDHASAGPTGSTANQGPNDVGVRMELTTTSNIAFNKAISGAVKVMFEIWEYIGDPGGEYEFITRYRTKAGGIGSGNTTYTSPTISGIVNGNKCIPFSCGYESSLTSNSDFEHVGLCLKFDSTIDKVRVTRQATSGVCWTAFQLVEFTGSKWNVGYAQSTNHDTNGGSGGDVVTMNDNADGSSGSTFDVSDWETAMIVEASMEGDTSETGLSDCLIYVYPDASTTQVVFRLDNSSSRNDGEAFAYVLQCDDLIVKRGSNLNFTEGNGSYGTPLSLPAGVDSSTPLDQLSLEWFPGTNGEGTAHARGRIHAQLADNSGYEIQHWVHRSGNDCKAYYGVADFSGLIPAGGSSTITPNSATHNHTAESGSFVQSHLISPLEGAHAHTSESPSLSQSYVISPSETTHNHTADESNLIQSNVISPNEGNHANTGEEPSLIQGHILSPNEGNHIHTGEESSLVQDHVLSPSEGQHAHTADEPTISLSATINPNSGSHSHTAGEVLLVQSYVIAPGETTNKHTSDEPNLSQSHISSPIEGRHIHTGEEPLLSQSGIIQPEEGRHIHTAEEASMSLSANINPDNCSHSHTSEEALITQGNLIQPEEASHNHISDSPTIFQGYVITPEECYHGHKAELANITQSNIIQPEECSHSHNSDEPGLVSGLNLSPNNGTHNHTSKEPSIIQSNIIHPSKCSHTHIADEVSILQSYVISPENNLHSHKADDAVLIYVGNSIKSLNNTIFGLIKRKNNTLIQGIKSINKTNL